LCNQDSGSNWQVVKAALMVEAVEAMVASMAAMMAAAVGNG